MVSQISIHSERGIIGIESKRGSYEINRPQPEVTVNSQDAVITADNRPGTLRIDQRKTNDALNGGKLEDFWIRIYSQYKDVVRQNMIEIVERGNRMGDLRIKSNQIAEQALDKFVSGAPQLEVYGPASPDNVDFEYIPNDVNIQVDPGRVEIEVQTFRPEVNFYRGYVRVYMEQYPSVTITPPVINIRS